jgi:Thoeris protein ThsB, TIR-like domain
MADLQSLLAALQIKRKVFVSYHHGGDQRYYNAFSKIFHDTLEIIYDNSLERIIDSEDADYVMRRIRENYISGTSCTIVLVGKDTWGRKYVDWEIKATLEKEHGLIGVRLPTAPVTAQNTILVPERLHLNCHSGYAIWLTWEQLANNPGQLAGFIEQANSRNKMLISNDADRRLRNAA